MSHKTMIDGVAYEISGGKTLVGGTAYSIKNGKTLVGGTGYDVGFSKDCTVIITFSSIDAASSATVGDTTYKGNSFPLTNEVVVPSGTEAAVALKAVWSKGVEIYMNGILVKQEAETGDTSVTITAEYAFTITKNTTIVFSLPSLALRIAEITEE